MPNAKHRGDLGFAMLVLCLFFFYLGMAIAYAKRDSDFECLIMLALSFILLFLGTLVGQVDIIVSMLMDRIKGEQNE